MIKQFNKLKEIGIALKGKHQTGRSFHLTGIFLKNRLISLSSNNYKKTHPQILNYNYHKDSKLHSEMLAALKLGLIDCSKFTLINLRINNNNVLDNSKPCKGCSELIRGLNFKNVYYSSKDGKIEEFQVRI